MLCTIAIVILLFTTIISFGQNVGINATGAPPVATAGLDIDFTDRGLLIPRMTAVQRAAIASPATGLIVFQTDAPAGIYFYDGVSWIQMTTVANNPWTRTSPNVYLTTGTDNVGIGTTSPVSNLDVTTVNGVSGIISLSQAGIQRWQIINNATSGRLDITRQALTPSLAMDVAGNVGIGTTSPVTKLQLQGAGPDASGLSLTNTSAGGRTFFIEGGDNTFYSGQLLFRDLSGGADPIMVMAGASGNVGIGNTSPNQKLEVTGNARITSLASGASGAIVKTNSSGDFAVTNFSGSATDVLLGNATFGAIPSGSGNYIQNQTAADQAAGFRINGNGLFNGGQITMGTATPASASTLLTANTSATYTTGIGMTLSGGSGTGINISSATVNYNGILVSNSTASLTSSVYNIGGVLSSTNIVSGYNAYRNGSGLSYGLYGINGTNAAYATNASTWAAFLQGRTVISSESSPSSPLGTDLEIRNTTAGAGNPATVSLRQTTSNTTSATVLNNINFGDNHSTSPQAQIQVIRDAAGGAGDLPTAIAFSTTPDATTTLTERMRIMNNGNVGIGTTAPAFALDVIQPANIAGSGTISTATAGGVTTITGVGTSFLTQVPIGSGILASGQTTVVTSVTSNTSMTAQGPFSPDVAGVAFTILPAWGRFQNAGTNLRYIFNGSGFTVNNFNTTTLVGGTTAPAVKLQDTRAGGKNLDIANGKQGVGVFQIADLQDGLFPLTIDMSGGTLATLNVGIGTSSPASLLDVRGGRLFVGTNTFAKAAGQTGDIDLDNGGTDSPGIHFYTAANTNFGIDVSTDLRFVSNLDEAGGAVRMGLTAAGTLKLNAYTTNGILRTTGGTGTLSSTGGNINLTSEVTGTLPVGNGGTGTATAFTQGSVVFAGASGVYSQNNANFFWDNTNTRLGIGTASPTNSRLHIVSPNYGGIRLDRSGGDANTRNWQVGISTRVEGDFEISQSTAAGGDPWAATSWFYIKNDGNVGISSTSPGQKLDVQGGNINTSGNIMTGGTVRLDASGNLINIGNITATGASTYTTGAGSTLALQGGNSSSVMGGGVTLTAGTSGTNIAGANVSLYGGPGGFNGTGGQVNLTAGAGGESGGNGAYITVNGGGANFGGGGNLLLSSGLESPGNWWDPGHNGAVIMAINGTEYMRVDGNRDTYQGYVGIGTSSPAAKLSVGSTSQFQINSTGAIAAATGITSSGTINFSGLSTNGIVRTTGGAGTLSSSGGAINLTSEVTGTLPVGNGGTGTATAFTQGSVVFAGASGVYSQNNANFFWDNTSNRLGIGIASPNEQLEITKNFRLPATTSTTGIIYSDANRYIHNYGSNNFFAGVGAGNFTLTGSANIGIGVSALAANTSGQWNTAIGYFALTTNNIGSGNTANGFAAMQLNTSGGNNTANGGFALYQNQTGSNNTVSGYEAGKGVAANSFSNNSLLGYRAGFGLSTGSNNILLGYQAGDAITTGSNNIIIGYDIDAPVATSSNQMSIGNLIYATGVNGTGTTISTGNVGIGTTSPAAKLDVTGGRTNLTTGAEP